MEQTLQEEHVTISTSGNMWGMQRSAAGSRVWVRDACFGRFADPQIQQPVRWLRSFRANLLYGDPGVLNMLTGVQLHADQDLEMCALRQPFSDAGDFYGKSPQHASSAVQCGLHQATEGEMQGGGEGQCGLPGIATAADSSDSCETRTSGRDDDPGSHENAPRAPSSQDPHAGCFGWLAGFFQDMIGDARKRTQPRRVRTRQVPFVPLDDAGVVAEAQGELSSNLEDAAGDTLKMQFDMKDVAKDFAAGTDVSCSPSLSTELTAIAMNLTEDLTGESSSGRMFDTRDRTQEPKHKTRDRAKICRPWLDLGSSAVVARDRAQGPGPEARTRDRAKKRRQSFGLGHRAVVARDRAQGPRREAKTRERAKTRFGATLHTGPLLGPPSRVQDFPCAMAWFAGGHLQEMIRQECCHLLESGALLTKVAPGVNEDQRTTVSRHVAAAHVPLMARHTPLLVGDASHGGCPSARWRAGGPDLLESLKPLIEKLVRDAIQQALKDLLPGSRGDARAVVLADSSEKARRKKGKGVNQSGGRQSQQPPAKPTPQPAEKGKGKAGKPAVTEVQATEGRGGHPHKGQGKAGKGRGEESSDDGGWTTVQRRRTETADASFVLEPRDWEAPIIDIKALAKAFDDLPANDVLKGVVLCNATQAATATTMAKGSKLKYSLSLVTLDKNGTTKIPGKVSGQRRFVTGTVLKLNSEGVQAPKLAGRATPVNIAKKTTTIMFLRIPRIFAGKAWQDFKKAPNRGAMAWAAKYGVRFVDTFGWKEQRSEQGIEQLYGLARVAEDAVKDILRVSGTEGIFVEPHRKQLPTRVTWVPPEKNEAHDVYLERVFKGKGELGLATCGNTLGHRFELLQGDRVKRAWLLRDAPLEWGFLEAAEALQATFKDVTITSCKRVRSLKSFSFKATADVDADRDAVPVSIIYDGNETTLWAVWALPRQGQLKQRTVRPDSVPALDSPQLQATAQTAEPLVVLDEDGKENPAPKKQKVPDSTRAYPKELVLRAQPRDGNCVFHSLASGLAWVTSSSKNPINLTAREMRARITEHLRKHSEIYEKEYDGKGPCGATMPFKDYLDAISQEGSYGSQIEVKAFCRMYDTRCIVVPQHACFPCESFHNKASSRVLVLYLTGSPCSHMDLLLPAGANEQDAGPKTCPYPKELLDIRSPPSVPYRVGGKARSVGDSDAGTVFTNASSVTRTVWTLACGSTKPSLKTSCKRASSDRAESSSGRAHTVADKGPVWTRAAKRAARSTPGDANVATIASSAVEPTAGGGRSSLNELGDVANFRDLDDTGVEGQPVNDNAKCKPRNGQKRSSWNCPVPGCGFTCQGLTWAVRKSNHIKAWHPDRKRELDLSAVIRDPVDVAMNVSVAWKCPVCYKAFPLDWKLSRDQLRNWKATHGRKAHPEENQDIFKRRFLNNAPNARKATAVVRAKGVASRLSQIKRGIGDHPDIFTVDLPSATVAKRRVAPCFVCWRCRCVSKTAKSLAKMRCEPVKGLSQQRQAFLQRLERQSQDDGIDQRLRDGAARLVSFLKEAATSSNTVSLESAQLQDHDLEAISWPEKDRSIGIRFVCVLCCRLAKQERYFKRNKCQGVPAFAKYREAWLRELRPWLDDEGPRGKAARLAKAKIGIAEPAAEPDLPQGLFAGDSRMTS